jgi:sugar lactone lactonase YvrE
MKKTITLLATITLSAFFSIKLNAQTITTIAGTGVSGYSGDGSSATSAQLNTPNQIAIDAAGNLFIAEDYNHIVRKINTSGVISTIAGNGTLGFSGDGAAATSAQLNRVSGIAVDGAGNIYICDADNFRIRKINTQGIISTIAGVGTNGHSGDGGLATAAEIGFASCVQVDAIGNVYFAEQANGFCVRKINSSGVISTIAGTGVSGYSGDGGLAISAQLKSVSSICFDANGNLYISDFDGFRIRKVNTSGIINTIAGNGIFGSSGDGGLASASQVMYPYGLTVDQSGNLFFCESLNNKIRKIDAITGNISTFAGVGGFTGGYTGDGGPAISATFNNPSAITKDVAGNFYIGDYSNHVIRKITMGATSVQEMLNSKAELSVFPNPNNGLFQIKTDKPGIYTITNSLGEIINSVEIKTKTETVSFQNLPKGIYFINGKNVVKKIIVN